MYLQPPLQGVYMHCAFPKEPNVANTSRSLEGEVCTYKT
jgi:hypothetical protein